MFINRNEDIINTRCEKLESLGLKCLHQDSVVIHESFPNIEFDFSTIDLCSDNANRNILWYIIQVTSSVSFSKGENDIREKFNKLLTGE